MPSVQQLLIRTPFALLLIGAGTWGMLAIWFQSSLPEDTRSMLAAACLLALCLAAGSVILKSKRRFTLPLAYLSLLSVASWWTNIQPSDYRDWAPEVAKRATISISEEDIEVRNVRNFAWRGDRATLRRWETRTYRTSDLTSVDLIVAKDSGAMPSQSFASFGFGDGRRLAFAVEARIERNERFHWLHGLFRQYELTLVAADEADVVRHRSEALGEEVFRYRLDLRPTQVRQLFEKYSEFARGLDREPRFYNSLTSRVATAPFQMIRSLDSVGSTASLFRPFGGDTPEALFDRGLIASAASFTEVEAKARLANLQDVTPEEPRLDLTTRQGWSFADAPNARASVRPRRD